MPKFVEREIMAMINGGIEPNMVVCVLEYTACAPRPSWAYARTVLIRNEEKGITTASGFLTSLGNHGRAGDDAMPY
ncbi:MAG: DnaD domain protein [Clostridia bacterium]|nr:DnaD domain protein [Clostridia bacterium]